MLEIRRNISLRKYTSFKVGGKARYLLVAGNRQTLINGVAWAQNNHIPYIVLGCGSNILFNEKGYNGLIIINSWKEIRKNSDTIFVSSGLLMSSLVNFYLRNSFSGFEWAGGLPGSVGGAVRGNAGAFGSEIKDSIIEAESFTYINGKLEIIKRNNRECRFGYRDSIFKHNNEIILSATLKFTESDRKSVRNKINECKNYREEHQPLSYPSAGSFFKNIPVESVPAKIREEFKGVIKNDPFPLIPAAAVTDKLGLKGKTIGGAQVSEMHPNFIINKGGATFSDIMAVCNLIKRKALKKYGIKMETEVQLIETATTGAHRCTQFK